MAWNDHQNQIFLIGLSPARGMVRIFKIYSCRTSHDDNPPLLTASVMLCVIRSIKYIHVITEICYFLPSPLLLLMGVTFLLYSLSSEFWEFVCKWNICFCVPDLFHVVSCPPWCHTQHLLYTASFYKGWVILCSYECHIVFIYSTING